MPALLAEMDGMDDSGAFVMLAAITRAGHIDRGIRVTRPDESDAVRIFQIHLDGVFLEDGWTAESLAAAAALELSDPAHTIYEVNSVCTVSGASLFLGVLLRSPIQWASVMSKLIRRTHMYLALFLTPWVLMYTVSTFVMNHRDWFRGKAPAPSKWEEERVVTFDGRFADGASAGDRAREILRAAGLDGAHSSAERDGKLVIQRQAAIHPQRLTFDPAAGNRIVIERQVLEVPAFLERMHRRRGFQHPYALDDTWAFSVDLFIAAMIFWVLSGLWLWWELKATRGLGAFAAIGGMALFGFFLALL